MGNFIIYLDGVVNLYMYYVVLACFLSLVPNINPEFPLFNFIFTSAGFYIIPPIFGVSFSPMLVLILTVLTSMGLRKIYFKYFAKKERDIVILTKKEFEEKIKQLNIESKEDNKNDSKGNN